MASLGYFYDKAPGIKFPALIALVTCDLPRYRRRLEVCLKTWVPSTVLDFDFLLASSAILSPLAGHDVPDDYPSLPQKMSEVFRLANRLGYEGLWKIDDDSIVFPGLPRPPQDYCGKVLGGQHLSDLDGFRDGYCSGGAYWLSARSLAIMAEAEPPLTGAEDGWVGSVLSAAGIFPQDTNLVGYWTDRNSGITGRHVQMQCPDIIGVGATKRIPPGESAFHGHAPGSTRGDGQGRAK
jgi:hypothetical protein